MVKLCSLLSQAVRIRSHSCMDCMPYAPQLNCRFHVAHLNHCLRSDADADADFVQQHASLLKLPCTVRRAEVTRLVKQWRLSVEAAGRRARYQFYEAVCTEFGATKVALGHHQDDTTETVLMNLIRGSGATGLRGIAPVRDIKVIRPLVRFTRKQIEAFLTSIGVTPRHDSTNTDRRYLRNRYPSRVDSDARKQL